MTKRIFTNEEIIDICNLYNKTLARKPIAKKYNCTDKVILRILNEQGVKIRHVQTRPEEQDCRKFKIDDDYFNIKKQTSNSAYILGLLASDGCVASSQNIIYIELQRSDREILEKINKELRNERPIKDYLNKSKNYENSKLYFYSKKIKNDLSYYNIIPNKTHYNNDFLENIESKFFIDYIRGYFDGDGCVKWVNGTIAWQIDSTSLNTLLHMQRILMQHGIITKVTEKKDKSIVNLPVYRIYFYGKENAKKLYQLFYESPSATLRMQRKQKHFADLLLKYNSHETL